MHAEMVKYGTRHWAHPVCLYKNKGIGAINELQPWQLRHLPILSMMEAGVSLEEVREWTKRIKLDDQQLAREGKPTPYPDSAKRNTR